MGEIGGGVTTTPELNNNTNTNATSTQQDGKKVSELTEITQIYDSDLFYLARPLSETQGKVPFNTLKEAINAGGIDFDLYGEASGNPASFADGSESALVECEFDFEPKQDLHGYSKPWAGGTGKNKEPLTLSGIKSANSGTWVGNTLTINDVTFTINVDADENVQSIEANGTATADATFMLCGTSSTPPIMVLSENMIATSGYDGTNTACYNIVIWGTTPYFFKGYQNLSSGYSMNGSAIRILSGKTADHEIFKPMLRSSSVIDDTFEPYSNICPIEGYDEITINVSPTNDTSRGVDTTIQLGDTYYGGTLNAVTGELVIDKVYLKLTSDLITAFNNTLKAGFTDGNYLGQHITACNALEAKYTYSTNTNTASIRTNDGRIALIPSWASGCTDLATFKAAYAQQTEIEVVHTITPITVQLTPTVINTLLGQNYISSDDTEDIDLVYVKKDAPIRPNPTGDAVASLKKIDLAGKIFNILDGGESGSKAYSGEDVPDDDFGSDGDIYFQMANDFKMSYATANRWSNVSVTKEDDGSYTIVTSGNGASVPEYVSYAIPNLQIGKTYTISFDAKMSSSATFYNQGRTYGVQFVDDPTDYDGSLSASGGTWDATNQYQSFYRDTSSHHYECTFTATATTMYLMLGYADVTDGINNTLTLSNVNAGIYNEIAAIWTKKAGIWIEYTQDVEQNLYGAFIDTNRVIQAFTLIQDTQEHTYTATEDCVVVYSTANSANGNTYVKVDNVKIGGQYTQNGIGAIDDYVYLKRGQTFSFQQTYTSSSTTGFTVYGLTFGTQNIFTPIIYSTEERVVGVWIDGKPLYCKTLDLGSEITAQTSGTNISSYMPNDVDQAVYCCLHNSSYNGTMESLLQYESGLWMLYPSQAFITRYVTIQYTKTTDTAGSGNYNTLGVPMVHYSTDEQVVGTDENGNTIYEKTFTATITSNVQNVLSMTGIDMIYKPEALAYDNSKSTQIPIPYNDGSDYASLQVYGGNLRLLTSNWFKNTVPNLRCTIRYTKTS